MALTLITGPMFADKTTTMIDLIKRAGSIKVIKPDTDNRYCDHQTHIITHNGQKWPAISIKPEKLLDTLESNFSASQTIFIDEYHFFPDIVTAVDIITECGADIVIAGVDLDYRRNPMPAFRELEARAKTHIQLKSKCSKCGKLARYTKLSESASNGGAASLIVGGAETYSPSCGECF